MFEKQNKGNSKWVKKDKRGKEREHELLQGSADKHTYSLPFTDTPRHLIKTPQNRGDHIWPDCKRWSLIYIPDLKTWERLDCFSASYL